MEETFDKDQILDAIRCFLEWGEKTYDKDYSLGNKSVSEKNGHGGYYSGSGWAARCLRYHYEQLKKEETK